MEAEPDAVSAGTRTGPQNVPPGARWTPRKPPPENSRAVKAGVLMIFLSVVLLLYFVRDPAGGLPGYPQYWKGGPLLLGACFFGAFGALVAALRRFSLGAAMLAAVLSGLLTAGMQSYVYSIRSSCSEPIYLKVADEDLPAYLEAAKETITSEHVLACCHALAKDGVIRGMDFDGLEFSYGAQTIQQTHYTKLTVTYSWNPYVYPAQTDARRMARAYIRMLNFWALLKARKMTGQHTGSVESDVANFCFSLRYMAHTAGLVETSSKKDAVERLLSGYAWMAEHEPDPELQEYCRREAEIFKQVAGSVTYKLE